MLVSLASARQSVGQCRFVATSRLDILNIDVNVSILDAETFSHGDICIVFGQLALIFLVIMIQLSRQTMK